MVMDLEEAVVDKLRSLPREKQQEVLDFVEFIEKRATPKKPGKSLHGIWRHLDITAKDIDQARREMWANFPREDF